MPWNQLGPLIVGLGPLALWFLAYATVLVVTRARRLRPAPPSPELGPEPPALVNLLVHQKDVTEDAAEATLLDLAARRILELRAPDPDPTHTTVHVRAADTAGLTRYESRVLERVTSRAVDGVAPLTALPFSDAAEADRWLGELRGEVIRDGRVRGLVANRLTGVMGLPFLFAAFGMPFAFGFGAALWGQSSQRGQLDPWTWPRFFGGTCAGVPVFVLLFVIVLRLQSMRLSRYGRQRAAQWLGVREWLVAHPTFADMPPAAAGLWDRYLAYGAALGVTDVASRTIHLGLGGRRTPWSSYGGRWRRVRVHPVRLPGLRALLPPRRAPLAGQVLWVWDGRIAIDDGTADEVRAWVVPAGLSAGVYGGDTVSATVQPWRGRVVGLQVTARGADWRASVAPATAAPSVFRAVAPSAAGLGCQSLLDALPAAELSTLARAPLRGVPGKRRVDYVSTVDGRVVLRLEMLDRIGDLERWRARPAGWVLSGVGDEAYFGPGWAVALLGGDFLLATAWPPADPGLPAQVVRTVLVRLAT